MPPNTNLFTRVYKRLPPPPHRSHSCIQTQHGERGDVGVIRERGRTADDRVIKAELHPPHQVGRRATVRPSTLLLMTWASKNWPHVHPIGSVAYNFSIWSVLCRCTATYGSVHCRTWMYGNILCLMSTCVRVECVDIWRRLQFERGIRTTNDGGTFIQMTVFEILIAILHRLHSEQSVGCHE